MGYIISKSNNETLILLNDGQIDTAITPLTLVGKNVSNFGDAQNENFVHLLENFANSSARLSGSGQPRSPLRGQLWFDTNPEVNRLLVYDGDRWRPLAVSIAGASPINSLINATAAPPIPYAANQPGDLFFNTTSKKLFVVSGTGTELTFIGPESVEGFADTRMASASMYDTLNNKRPVIQMIVDGEVVAVVSSSTFQVSATNTVAGFSRVYRGVTFKNYNSSTRYTTATTDVMLHGLHEQLDQSYPRRNVNEHIQGSWYFDNGASLFFGTSGNSSVTWSTTTSALSLASSSKINFSVSSAKLEFDGQTLYPTSTIDLGRTASPYNNLYATNVVSSYITATNIYQEGYRVLTAQTLPDAGVVGVLGTTNQIAVSNKVNGVVTVSLPSSITVGTVNATNISSTNIAGSNITDSGARVITTATLPYSVATITGVSNQITVNVTDRTATLGFSSNAVMTNLSASSISATNMFQGGYRVLTTATLAEYAVVGVLGTANQISASKVDGVVTLSLPSVVNASTINMTTAGATNLTSTNGTISALRSTNSTATNLTAGNASITSLTANVAGAGTLTVSNNATVYGNMTATNVSASSNLISLGVKAATGDFSSQLNAAQAGIIGSLTAGSITATGTSNFSNGTQKIRDVIEQVSIVGSPPSGTVNIDLIGASIIYYTSAANTNWSFNFRGNSSVSANSYLATGQSVTVTVLVTQDSTVGYYPTSCSIDGVTVTPKWFGGILPSSGEINCVNAFTFTIVKTGSASYSLFSSIMKYA